MRGGTKIREARLGRMKKVDRRIGSESWGEREGKIRDEKRPPEEAKKRNDAKYS